MGWKKALADAGISFATSWLSKKDGDESTRETNTTRFLSPEQQEELAAALQAEYMQELQGEYPIKWSEMRYGLAPALDRIEADAARARRSSTMRSVQSGQGERGRYLDYAHGATDRAELNANRGLLGEGLMQLAMAKPAWKAGLMNSMSNFLAAGSGQQTTQTGSEEIGWGTALGRAGEAFATTYADQNRNQQSSNFSQTQPSTAAGLSLGGGPTLPQQGLQMGDGPMMPSNRGLSINNWSPDADNQPQDRRW